MPSPMLTVNIEVPAWPAVDRARRRLDLVRNGTGRVATVAGAALAAAGLLADQTTGLGLVAVATATAVGLVSLRAWRPAGHQRATASVLYLMPGTSLLALLIAERLVPGIHWGEALALAVWTAATWVLRPARVARRMLCPPPLPAPVVDLDPVEEVAGHPAAQWWVANVAGEGGAAPGTLLEDVRRTGEAAMRAVIRSVTPGNPVPDISIKHLSALMDIPEDQIAIGPVPGRGAGVRLLKVGTPEETDDLATLWAKQIAPTAMPGTVLTEIQIGTPGGDIRTIPATNTAAGITTKENA
ncbi:hypothetical protein [Micrococcus luteus]|uniref:hypothetical protein n=1 Tax=Micrococcus luteus TaxID=1270 RepID=UPI00332B40B2